MGPADTFPLRAVSATTATTVLPRLAFDHGLRSITASPFADQVVMGMHVAPYAVMPPDWQGSEHRLHKRAPIGMSEWVSCAAAEHCADEWSLDAGDEEVDLVKRQFLGLHRVASKHMPAGSIPDAVAKKLPPKPKELYRIKKETKGDDNLFQFQVSRYHPHQRC